MTMPCTQCGAALGTDDPFCPKCGTRRSSELHVPADPLRDYQSVLLIGDKVVTTPMPWFDHHVDLGDAWKRWTGLPFVFAAWAARGSAAADDATTGELAGILAAARDRGVARAAEIAAETGPARGWPLSLAVEYMTHTLTYTLAPAFESGMNRFVELLQEKL